MAPKSLSSSRQPSKEKEEKEEPSSEEEEEEEETEEESEEGSSEEEKENPSQEENEEEPSSEDEEEDQQTVKGNKTPIPVPKSDKKDGSDSETESDGGSPSDYKLQPVSKTPKPAGKRTHEEAGNGKQSLTSSKRSRLEEKKSSSTPGGITRLWSNEDEIAVLNGMIEFRDVKGLDPNADMGAFHNFVKGKLKVDFSRDQLRTKINRMKKRFLNALKKGENGSVPVFSKPHEDMAFELSKKIWGGIQERSKNVVANGNHEDVKKDIVKAKKKIGGDEKEIVTKEKDGEKGDFWSKYPFLSISFGKTVGNFPSLGMPEAGMGFIKERLSSIGDARAKELDEKWKKLIVEENEINYKMLTLMKEQIKMAFDL
ncbi:hypothetical protein CDL12_12433 [Handroanthus impetiginosus]|uniref:Glabrous enhancer-binding protein-like DBD domain-containing protein n=1 Tax=Handroanthus impetiginosus TaxID=429701 RepID=A0A2G9HBT4_9LAMI|nr:hypothetical protein CDL12_12433 [Handroanthus impetiginosus]